MKIPLIVLITWMSFDELLGRKMLAAVPKYCRDKNRLAAAAQFDQYLLVDAEFNSSIQLDCYFCHDPYNYDAKMWYYQDRFRDDKEKPVKLDMKNDASADRIYLTPHFNLVIDNFTPKDVGIYSCHGVLGQDAEKKLSYRIEPIFKVNELTEVGRGNLTDWEFYREANLLPIAEQFAVSKMKELMSIRHSNIILEVISEWGVWGPCESCIRKIGKRTSRAQCRLKSHMTVAAGSQQKRNVVFFQSSPLLPCRSVLLGEEFPVVSRIVKDIPEFLLEESCKHCSKAKKLKDNKFKYVRTFTILEGRHLALFCPESNLKSNVVWKKDHETLKKGSGFTSGDGDRSAKILVDPFSTLFIVEATAEEMGNYSCYVNDEKMLQVTVYVVLRSRLFNAELRRHFGYLGCVFLISFLFYCAGLVIVFSNPDKFRKVSDEELWDCKAGGKRH